MPDTLLGGLSINEVLVDPNGTNNFDTDGNGAARGGDEFIELTNTSGSAIDISGLELWDRGRGNWFTFPSGTTLEAGAVVVVVRNVQNGGNLPSVSGDNLAFDAGFNSNVFNNNGDNLVVYDPTNDEFIQATYNGDSLDDPTSGAGYSGFSSTATRSGSGEDFGTDQDGFSLQRGSNGFINNETPTPGMQSICFASGTLLETSNGFKRIEELRSGDLLQTLDSGLQPIRWVFARRVTSSDLREDKALLPISIKSDTFDRPTNPGSLRVSRHHRILVAGKVAQRMFGQDQILVAAKDLLGCSGVSVDSAIKGFFYFHVLMDEHQILNANGIAAESLLLGKEALKVMTPSALAELRILFPKTRRAANLSQADPSRKIVSGARARHLVQRHIKNNKEVPAMFGSVATKTSMPLP